MKIPLKFGLLIALGVMAWVIVAHTLFPNPQSKVHSLGAVTFFNLLHFSMIYLGIKALERQSGDRPTFKRGLKAGVAISLVYAVSAALFFVAVLVFVGPKWMEGEAANPELPVAMVALRAFAGLVIGTMVFGLVYSTLIAFMLAKRLSSER
jgi:hypothetical protein